MATKVRKVVIPVAGLGTRGLPYTKEVPKELTPIIDVPTIHYIVEEVIAAGIEQVIFVTSKGKVALEDYFDLSPNLENWLVKRGKNELAEKVRNIGQMVEVISVRQKSPLGLGHAVWTARHVVGDEPFAVCLGDEIYPSWDAEDRESPFLQRLVQQSERDNCSVVGVVKVLRSETKNYGMIDIAGKTLGKGTELVRRTVEKPKPEDAPSEYGIIGRYVFKPEIFAALAETKAGVGGEIQLTDGMDRLCRDGKLRALLATCRRYDVGNPFYFLQATIDEALRRPELSDRLREYCRNL